MTIDYSRDFDIFELGRKGPQKRYVIEPPPGYFTQKELDTIANNEKAAPNWGVQTIWTSSVLLPRQRTLATYSMELAYIFDTMRSIAEKATKTKLKDEDVLFVADFGTPMSGETHTIQITLKKPVPLNVSLTRSLTDGKLKWNSAVAAMMETPTWVDVTKLVDLDYEPPSDVQERRTIKL